MLMNTLKLYVDTVERNDVKFYIVYMYIYLLRYAGSSLY